MIEKENKHSSFDVVVKYEGYPEETFHVSFDKDLCGGDISGIIEYIKDKYNKKKKGNSSFLRKLRLTSEVRESNININFKYSREKLISQKNNTIYEKVINYKEDNIYEILENIKHKISNIIETKDKNSTKEKDSPKFDKNEKFNKDEIEYVLNMLEQLNELYKYLGKKS